MRSNASAIASASASASGASSASPMANASAGQPSRRPLVGVNRQSNSHQIKQQQLTDGNNNPQQLNSQQPVARPSRQVAGVGGAVAGQQQQQRQMVSSQPQPQPPPANHQSQFVRRQSIRRKNTRPTMAAPIKAAGASKSPDCHDATIGLKISSRQQEFVAHQEQASSVYPNGGGGEHEHDNYDNKPSNRTIGNTKIDDTSSETLNCQNQNQNQHHHHQQQQQQHQTHSHNNQQQHTMKPPKQPEQPKTQAISATRSLSLLLLGFFDRNCASRQQQAAQAATIAKQQVTSSSSPLNKQQNDSRKKSNAQTGQNNNNKLPPTRQTTIKSFLSLSSTSSNKQRQQQQQHQLTAAVMLASYMLLILISCLVMSPSVTSGQIVNPNKLLSTRNKLTAAANSRNLDGNIAGHLSSAAASPMATSSSSTSSSSTSVTSSSSSSSSSSTGLQNLVGGSSTKEGKLLVCYYTNWSQYRPKEGKYVPEDIDPHLCTHVIVAFGWMKKNRLAPFDASDESKDGKKGLYERVTSLKLANPALKVLIAVGGWSFGTERFKTMAVNRYNRQLFIFSALEFLRERNFDGLDIDWEFPQASDKKNFVDLLKELREAFDAEAKEKRLPKLLLTCAVSAGSEIVRAGYDVAPIGSYVDFINIMSYDFHGKWETKTGHNAPLFASAGESEWRKQLSIDYGVKLWERMGAPKSKLVIGLATYGRSFTLTSPAQHGMNAPSSGGGKAGEFTKEAGFLAFYEICDMLKTGGASYYWDEEQAVPYAVQGDQWVGFDDELSIRNKVKWLNEQGFAGAMVWALDMDDFKGTCTPKKYPLIRAMAEGLFNLPVRPSQEWRSIIESARARAQVAQAAALAASSSVSKQVAGAGGLGAAGLQLATGAGGASELAAAAAVAAAAAANQVLNSAGISSPATADAVRAAIAALGPAALANGAASGELAQQLKHIPGLNITSLLSSPSGLAALSAANPQLANQLLLQQQQQLLANNRSLESTNARIVCYYTNWSYKRPGSGRFGPDNLDPHLCTHIIYAFYGLKDSKLVPTEEIDSSDNEQAPYKRLIALKQVNPNLKVMLAVGGWMMGYAPFRQLTENTYRQTFFTFEVIEFLRKRQFDGLDLCWEFPRGLDDKEKFSNLVKELRESFDGEAKSSGKPRLILTAAVPASFEAIAAGYDVPTINKYLDFMNVMTYDFHGDWEQVVGHNSPLYPLNSATAYQKKLTLDFSAAEWVRQGASKENLVIGLPTYGRTFTLANPNLTDIDAPAARGGKPGQFTRESGFLSFFEVCEMLKNQATLVWDNEQMIPYAYKGDQWVGFDDPRSFKMKVQWLKQNGYSGIMIWSVDMDDFAGTCMGLKYPLIKSAKEELKGYYVPNLVETAQGSSIHPAIGNKDELQCEETDGHITYHKDKKDCTMYYMCEGTRKHHMPCPQNLVFNQNENVCDWPENVEGCGKVTTETSATPTG